VKYELLSFMQRSVGNSATGRWLGLQATTASIARQADAGVADASPADAGPRDAGVPLAGGVPPTAEELEQARLRAADPATMADSDLGPALELARRDHDQARASQITAQIRDRDDGVGFGVGLPGALPRGQGGAALVTPEVALEMLENVLAGRPPFRPELGVGGSSWFVTEGSPYTGVGAENVIPVQAELISTEGGTVYQQADLDRIYGEEAARARPEVELQVRDRFRIQTGRDAPAELSNALVDRIERQLRGLAERRMWERIGREVAGSSSKVGEVVLPAGGRFSAVAGRFKVVADAAKIRLRGGPMPLLRAIETSGVVSPVPALSEATEELARTLRLAGRVRSVLRVGGRILVVVAIATDIYEIIVAEDHLEATIVSAVGWAGASAGAAAFSALWTLADTAGPWAWVGHGVGVLVSGAAGYWVGANVTRYVYRLVVPSRGQIRAAQ
jgi:hypothetical protein